MLQYARSCIKKSLIIFIIIIFFLSYLDHNSVPTIKASTYIEDDITQDTTWTLEKSPYIIIENILIHPEAELIIEPGTEIKFRSRELIVEGNLCAIGTRENMIKFTSNRANPSNEDWDGIVVRSNNARVEIINCKIEYSKNGIYFYNVNGGLIMNNSFINNKISGLIISHSSVNIDIINNKFFSSQVGVYIYKPHSTDKINNIFISGNYFEYNDEGIKLSCGGEPPLIDQEIVSNVSIYDNIILRNEHGIVLHSFGGFGKISDVIIKNNKISENEDIGIFIIVEPKYVNIHNVKIIDNIMRLNKKGIYTNIIDAGVNEIKINSNDISDNDYGAYCIGDKGKINAENNYWGDPRGPYHESINSKGKGNQIQMIEEDTYYVLDFIPYLTESTKSGSDPPIPILELVDQIERDLEFTVDGSRSLDPDGEIVAYLFEFDDGTDSGWIAESLITHTFHYLGTHVVTLKVMDDDGLSSKVSELIMVVEPIIQAKLENLEISPYEVEKGQPVIISAFLSNIDIKEGYFIVILTINDDFEEEKLIYLLKGESKKVEFKVIKTDVGAYNVEINGLKDQFEIVGTHETPSPTPAHTATPTPTHSPTPAPTHTPTPFPNPKPIADARPIIIGVSLAIAGIVIAIAIIRK